VLCVGVGAGAGCVVAEVGAALVAGAGLVGAGLVGAGVGAALVAGAGLMVQLAAGLGAVVVAGIVLGAGRAGW
jgi:hypothetical protein